MVISHVPCWRDVYIGYKENSACGVIYCSYHKFTVTCLQCLEVVRPSGSEVDQLGLGFVP